jgi:membrane fusion protein, multidrug efflux system
MKCRAWIGSLLLLVTVVTTAGCLAAWKYASLREAAAASANQPEPAESVAVAVARPERLPADHHLHRNGDGAAVDHVA